MPVAVGFSFDREGLNATQINDLVRQSAGKIHFIARRTYENYLLNSAAIAAVASMEDGFGNITAEQVGAWITAYAGRYSKLPVDMPLSDLKWLTECDAPKLLAALFSELSETRVEFRKTRHSRLLTEWLIKHNRAVLDELIEYVSNFRKAA